MALFARRERPPATALAPLSRGDRLVSWADTVDGDAHVVASRQGVWWPDDPPRLIRWQHIDKATWRDDWLSITEADVVDDMLLVDRPEVRVRLARPRDLPPTIRKRVEQNIVRTELLTVGGGAVRFVARRVPGRDGVVWWARLEPGTHATEQVRSAISARLAILRADQAR